MPGNYRSSLDSVTALQDHANFLTVIVHAKPAWWSLDLNTNDSRIIDNFRALSHSCKPTTTWLKWQWGYHLCWLPKWIGFRIEIEIYWDLYLLTVSIIFPHFNLSLSLVYLFDYWLSFNWHISWVFHLQICILRFGENWLSYLHAMKTQSKWTLSPLLIPHTCNGRKTIFLSS